ncbi:hypothetical protein BLNAU_12561 [Blattamonas nauphoetae]|uniref:Uncharacterized protein n=1 Tax=Blattamonas nauphoetae TaxID=2049346 RepID=A0ABQ9XMN1_9EUKA|nr:hypothetical protein BLNAU_12561 [Blattamonas nauphoetae]
MENIITPPHSPNFLEDDPLLFYEEPKPKTRKGDCDEVFVGVLLSNLFTHLILFPLTGTLFVTVNLHIWLGIIVVAVFFLQFLASIHAFANASSKFGIFFTPSRLDALTLLLLSVPSLCSIVSFTFFDYVEMTDETAKNAWPMLGLAAFVVNWNVVKTGSDFSFFILRMIFHSFHSPPRREILYTCLCACALTIGCLVYPPCTYPTLPVPNILIRLLITSAILFVPSLVHSISRARLIAKWRRESREEEEELEADETDSISSTARLIAPSPSLPSSTRFNQAPPPWGIEATSGDDRLPSYRLLSKAEWMEEALLVSADDGKMDRKELMEQEEVWEMMRMEKAKHDERRQMQKKLARKMNEERRRRAQQHHNTRDEKVDAGGWDRSPQRQPFFGVVQARRMPEEMEEDSESVEVHLEEMDERGAPNTPSTRPNFGHFVPSVAVHSPTSTPPSTSTSRTISLSSAHADSPGNTPLPGTPVPEDLRKLDEDRNGWAEREGDEEEQSHSHLSFATSLESNSVSSTPHSSTRSDSSTMHTPLSRSSIHTASPLSQFSSTSARLRTPSVRSAASSAMSARSQASVAMKRGVEENNDSEDDF